MRQARFALKDIWRNLVAVLLFVGLLTFTIYYMVRPLNDLMLYQDSINQMQRMMNYDITTFIPAEPPDGGSTQPREAMELLENALAGPAYCIIEQRDLSPELNELDVEVYYLFGQADEIFRLDPQGLQQSSSSPFTVLIGDRVSGLDVGDIIALGDEFSPMVEVPVDGYLPRNATLPDIAFLNYLDHSIVVFTTITHWDNHHITGIRPLISGIHFVDASDEEIYNFMDGIAQYTPFELRPVDLNSRLDTIMGSYRDEAFISTFINFTALALIGVAIVSNLLFLMERNLREYAINRLYGATLIDLYKRTFIYLGIIFIPPFAVGYWHLEQSLTYNNFSNHISWLLPMLAILIIFLAAIYPFIKLKKQDVAASLRRD